MPSREPRINRRVEPDLSRAAHRADSPAQNQNLRVWFKIPNEPSTKWQAELSQAEPSGAESNRVYQSR